MRALGQSRRVTLLARSSAASTMMVLLTVAMWSELSPRGMMTESLGWSSFFPSHCLLLRPCNPCLAFAASLHRYWFRQVAVGWVCTFQIDLPCWTYAGKIANGLCPLTIHTLC